MKRHNTALITGCTKGLGFSLAKEYLSHGWHVFAVARESQPLHSLREHYPTRLHIIIIDITSADARSVIHNELAQQNAKLNVVINNAGMGGRGYSAAEVEIDFLAAMFRVHCAGALSVIQACQSFLHDRHAKIVNISSRLASLERNTQKAYSGSFSYTYRIAKASQNMLTVCLAGDPSFHHTIICCIHPGRIKTDSAAPDAEITAEEAARRLKAKVDSLIPEDHGKFLDACGGIIPW